MKNVIFLCKYLKLSLTNDFENFALFFSSAAAAENSDIINCTFLEAIYILNIPNTYEGGI